MVAGRVALITEYVIGADLDDCLKGPDPIGLRAVLEVIARVGEALHAAYTASSRDGEPLHLVHRDVKPSNIRIGIHGEVKLLDFGIAKATNLHREAKTQTNTVLGSMPYLAPERFDEGGDTPLSDVYSLGCTLYEVIQREHLFEGLSVRQQYFHALDPEKHDAFVGQEAPEHAEDSSRGPEPLEPYACSTNRRSGPRPWSSTTCATKQGRPSVG